MTCLVSQESFSKSGSMYESIILVIKSRMFLTQPTIRFFLFLVMILIKVDSSFLVYILGDLCIFCNLVLLRYKVV